MSASIEELRAGAWVAGLLGAFLVGLAKGGLPGVGNLAIPLYALAFGAKASVGILLPVLLCADVAAVLIYRRNADWRAIHRVLPAALIGLGLGFLLFDAIPASVFSPVVGVIMLVMTALHFLRLALLGEPSTEQTEALAQNWAFRGTLGTLLGTTTMLANAAGPVGALYLMALRLPRATFLGTAAWFFFILNVVKLPFQAILGTVSPGSLSLSVLLGGAAVAGALLGPHVAQRLPEKAFSTWVWVMVVLAAVKMLWN